MRHRFKTQPLSKFCLQNWHLNFILGVKDSEPESDLYFSISLIKFSCEGEALLSKRKRKAAWEDEDDSKVLVKDVTATYKKAVGKHGEAETSEEQYR